jgi:effector-binding domain-containing protein
LLQLNLNISQKLLLANKGFTNFRLSKSMRMKRSWTIWKKFAPVAVIAVLAGCSGNDKKQAPPKTVVNAPLTDIKPKEKDKPLEVKPGIINIQDTISPRTIVLYMKDSAASFERIGGKLGKIYAGKLSEVIKKSGVKMTGAPMAWYKTFKAPYFFEAGVPVNKKPGKLASGVLVREMAADSAMVAHFYGPYNLLSQGYDALKERLKDEKKKNSAPPYEIYVGDPYDKNGKPIDPYRVRTDIVFPHH